MNTSEILGLAVQLLVAAGTGALAFFTWRLAKSTSRSVSEAKAERKLTEQALAASNRIAQAAETNLRRCVNRSPRLRPSPMKPSGNATCAGNRFLRRGYRSLRTIDLPT